MGIPAKGYAMPKHNEANNPYLIPFLRLKLNPLKQITVKMESPI